MAEQQKQFQIDLTPEIEDGVYSNMAIVTHSSAEFVLDFVRVLPGNKNPKVKSRVVMAPEHAKRLLFALQDNVMKYEKQFGTIDLHNTEPIKSGGFNMPKGEA